MEFRKMVTMTLYARQQKRYSCKELYFGLCRCFLGGSDRKECLHCRRPGFDSWVRKIPWRRNQQPTLVFLPRKIPWMVELGGLQTMKLQRVRHD